MKFRVWRRRDGTSSSSSATEPADAVGAPATPGEAGAGSHSAPGSKPNELRSPYAQLREQRMVQRRPGLYTPATPFDDDSPSVAAQDLGMWREVDDYARADQPPPGSLEATMVDGTMAGLPPAPPTPDGTEEPPSPKPFDHF